MAYTILYGTIISYSLIHILLFIVYVIAIYFTTLRVILTINQINAENLEPDKFKKVVKRKFNFTHRERQRGGVGFEVTKEARN